MKLGILSTILEKLSFEDMIDTIAEMGFACVEVACWPKGQAERRYAGVCHIDVESVNEQSAAHILRYCKQRGVEISALAFYPNMLDRNFEKREANMIHLKKVIAASEKLKVGMVTTFIGRDQEKSVEENLEIFEAVWLDIIRYAEAHNVKIAIENCPMLFGKEQWPGGQNLASTPRIWREIFRRIPSDYLGLNYDPSHFVWQMMDYIAPLYEFRDKIFHIHYKDIKVYPDRLKEAGIMAYPLEYMSPKLPGLGDVDWSSYVSALNDIGYKGYGCIEIEDKSFEGSQEEVLNSLVLSKCYMEQFVV